MAKFAEMLHFASIGNDDIGARRIGMSADQVPATVTTIGGRSYV
jgi:hypothetical protein